MVSANNPHTGLIKVHRMSTTNTPIINESLVYNLISSQFPHWKNLPIRPVAVSGWDNRTFHLGSHMLVRMPSAQDYELQVAKEHMWLPKLAPFLPLQIPTPLVMGKPAYNYPYHWSVYTWIDGETATSCSTLDLCTFAKSLADFLNVLHTMSTAGGPLPGLHSFYRGAPLTASFYSKTELTSYDMQARESIKLLAHKIDTHAVFEVWERVSTTTWQHAPVWVHGDISAGNLLLKDGQLSAVIDFGQLSVGDPACDLAIAWTFLDAASREIFRSTLSLDDGTWLRGQAWALWKALIIASGIANSNTSESVCLETIDEIIADHNK